MSMVSYKVFVLLNLYVLLGIIDSAKWVHWTWLLCLTQQWVAHCCVAVPGIFAVIIEIVFKWHPELEKSLCTIVASCPSWFRLSIMILLCNHGHLLLAFIYPIHRIVNVGCFITCERNSDS